MWQERERERERERLYDSKSYNLKEYTDYADKYLLHYFREHKDTTFHLVIAPYSRTFWLVGGSEGGAGRLKLWQDILRYIVTQTQDLSNVRIYGFDIYDYLGNMANYTDATHYNVDMHEFFADAIIHKSNILTTQNIESYLDSMRAQTLNYDLTPLLDMLDAKVDSKLDSKHYQK